MSLTGGAWSCLVRHAHHLILLAAVITAACAPPAETINLDELPAEERASAQNVTIIRNVNPTGTPYRRLSAVEAASCKKSRAAPPPTMGNALERLQYKAHLMGANAVAGVSCVRTGIDPRRNCWQSIVCSGTALKFDAPYRGNRNSIASSSGSGFVFNRHGYVLTNAHVVKKCTGVRVRLQGDVLKATVAAVDSNSDIAVLKTGYASRAYLAFGQREIPTLSEEVVVLGYPLRGILSSELHATSGDITALSGLRGDSRFLQFSAPVQPGNSGSPVIALSGDVIGMVVSKLNAMSVAGSTGDIPQNVNFAIKGGPIKSFLASRGIEYSTQPVSVTRKKTDLVENARAAAVAVLCDK